MGAYLAAVPLAADTPTTLALPAPTSPITPKRCGMTTELITPLLWRGLVSAAQRGGSVEWGGVGWRGMSGGRRVIEVAPSLPRPLHSGSCEQCLLSREWDANVCFLHVCGGGGHDPRAHNPTDSGARRHGTTHPPTEGDGDLPSHGSHPPILTSAILPNPTPPCSHGDRVLSTDAPCWPNDNYAPTCGLTTVMSGSLNSGASQAYVPACASTVCA